MPEPEAVIIVEQASETTPVIEPVAEEPKSDEIPTETVESLEPETTPDEETAPVEEPEPEAQNAVTPTEEGTLFVNNEATRSAAPNVDTQTGELSYAYEIQVPPGRNGMTPDISLRYSSNATDNTSMFGYGWSVSIPYVERMNKLGMEKMYASSTEAFRSSLDGELVRVGTSTEYRPRVENGAFRKYLYSGTGWSILEKDGRALQLGVSSSTRRDNPASSTQVFSWHLESEQVTDGNRIDYTYYKDAGQIYPQTVTYTSHGTSTGAFSVSFSRESRGDDLVSMETGFRSTTTYRISRIETSIDASWVFRYDLGYGTGQNGIRSMLTSVTRSGRDESATVTTLPSTNFTYEKNNTTSTRQWVEESGWDVPVDVVLQTSGHDQGARFVDINGDSLTDIVRSWNTDLHPNNPSPWNVQQGVWLNTGSGWATSTAWTLPKPYAGRFGFVLGYEPNSMRSDVDTGARFADVNSDGFTDILWSYQTDYVYIGSPSYSYDYDIKEVWMNNQVDGWATSTAWVFPSDISFMADGGDGGGRVADINGDGLPDLFDASKTYLNNGAGWTLAASSTYAFPEPLTSGYGDPGTRMADINGDGLVDVVRYHATDNAGINPAVSRVMLNTGSGWATSTAWTVPVPFSYYKHSALSDLVTSARLADVTGDGLPDIIRSSDNTYWTDGDDVYVNTGEGWSSDSAWTVPPYFKFGKNTSRLLSVDAGFVEMDADGDNMLDFVKSGPTNTPTAYDHDKGVYLHGGSVPDLLTGIEYPEGLELALTYEQSSRYEDGGNLANPRLASNLNTVQEIEYDDAVADPYIHTYFYGGGVSYFASSTDNQFAGFATTTQTDARGNATKTYIHQGNGSNTALGEYADAFSKIGKPYLVERYDDDDNLYTRTITRWDNAAATSSSSTFVFAAREVRQDWDGDGYHRDTAEERTYDAYGNLASSTEWGEVTATSTDGSFTDTGSDQRTTGYTYAASSTGYLASLPATVTLLDSASSTVRAARYYYDGQSAGVATAGHLTTREDWIASSTYATSRWTYGSTGLVATSIDPRGATTTYTYESKDLYPRLITNPLGHTASSTYDYSSGKSKVTVDGNGLTSERVYDGLDRVTEEKGPDPTSGTSVTLATHAYTDTRNHVAMTTNRYLAASSTVPVYVYYDGLGRKIQERVRAEESDTYAVRDWVYGDDGLLMRESLPYFAEDDDNDPATDENALYADYAYDPLGRLVSRQDAVGETTTAYDQWSETMTDANGVDKDLQRDAYNRLIGVVEHNGTSTYQTSYTWNQNDDLTGIEDALDNVRTFTYDGLGRRLTAQDLHATGDGTYGSWNYAYDANGNVTQTTDPKSQVTTTTYDLLNRPTAENFLGGAGIEVSYGYDSCTNGVGKLCAATTTSAVSRYAYAPSGQVAVETRIIGGTTFVTTSTYDRAGNALEATYPDSSAVRYAYNAAGQLETVEHKESGGSYAYLVKDLDYAPHGQVALQENANGSVTTNLYDADHLYRLGRKSTVVYAEDDSESFMLRSRPEEELIDPATIFGKDGQLPDAALEAAPQQSFAMSRPLPAATSTPTSTRFAAYAELKKLPANDPELRLKASPDRHLGTLVEDGFVRYAYRTDTSLDDLPADERTLEAATTMGVRLGTEEVERRTKYARTFATSRPNVYVMEIESGDPKYYEDGKGRWWLAEYGVTTEAAYQAQLKEPWQKTEEDTGVWELISSLFVPARAMAATGTFYPDPNTETSSVDGYLRKDDSTSWSTTRSASAGTSGSDSATSITVAGEHGGSSKKIISRGFLLFDTSAIPNTASILSADLGLYMTSSYTAGGELRMYVVGSTPASNTALGNGDYDQVGGTSFGVSDGAYTLNTYETIPLNASGQAAVSVTGVTKLGVRSYHDFANVNPSNSDEMNVAFSSADQTGTSQDPKLVVAYNSAPSIATSTQTEGSVNPSSVVDNRPEFSSVFVDPETGDTGTSYQIQVSVSPTDWSVTKWDSGKVAVSPITNGARGPEIQYAGDLLIPGKTYYWRMRYWDTLDTAGAWSTATSTFSIAPPRRIFDSAYLYDDVGNVTAVVDLRDAGNIVATQYAYDDLSRLIQVATSTATVDDSIDGTIVIQPDSSSGKDSMRNDSSSYNNGSGGHYEDFDSVSVGGWGPEWFSYLQFPLGDVPDVDDIEYATLELYNNTTSTNPNQAKAFRITESWTDSGIDRLDYPASTDVGMSWQPVPDPGWWSTEISPLLRSWKNGSVSNYGVMVEGIDHLSNTQKSFFSSEYASDPTKRPKLVIQTVQPALRIPDIELSATTTVTGTFGYDALGNLLTKSGVGSYVYAGTGYANPHAATTIASSSMSYDNNGNVTAYDTLSLGWTYRNELASTTVGTSTVTYGYDQDGGRVLKTGSATNKYPSRLYEVAGSTSTKRVYAGNELIATILGTGTSTASTTYVHADHLASTRVTTDADGQTVQELDYAPFGEVVEDTLSGIGEHRQYIGETYDPESELSYLNARYYEGSRGQFLSQDPVFWELGMSPDGQAALRNPQTQNSYSYAANNPISLKDPSGRYVESGFDVLMFALSVDAFRNDQSFTNAAAVILDALSIAAPVVPAVGGISLRGAKLANEANKASDVVTNATKVAETASQAAKGSNIDTLKPGSYAGESIPARSQARDFSQAERGQINQIGNSSGCHNCGSKNPGTKSGNFVPDHQPVSSRVSPSTPQRLYPHCINCSRVQGGQSRAQGGSSRYIR